MKNEKINIDAELAAGIERAMKIDNGLRLSHGQKELTRPLWIEEVLKRVMAPHIQAIQDEQQVKVIAALKADPALTYAQALAIEADITADAA